MLSGFESFLTIMMTGSLLLFCAAGRAGLTPRHSLRLLTTYAAAVLAATLTAFTISAVDLQGGCDGWLLLPATAGTHSMSAALPVEFEALCVTRNLQGAACPALLRRFEQSPAVSAVSVTAAYRRLPYALPRQRLVARGALPPTPVGWNQGRRLR